VDDRSYRPFHPARRDFYTTDAFTDHAIEYLDQYGNQPEPFVLYLAFTAPHYPLHAPPELINKYLDVYRDGWESLRTKRYQQLCQLGLFPHPPALSPRDPKTPDWQKLSDAERSDWQRRMAVYAAMIERVDWNIGRVLAKLTEMNREQNTLVLFLSDNGGEANGTDWSREPGTPAGPVDSFRTVGQPWAHMSNVPFRLYKTSNHEGGIATPLIARWPGRIAAGSVSHQVGHVIDVMPTLLELAEADAREPSHELAIGPLPGVSLAPMLRDASRRDARTIFWRWQNAGAIRDGEWKLVRAKANGSTPGPWELFRMDTDRSELHDLSAMHPDLVAELAAKWKSSQP
jgi:arylsulfatase